MSYKFDGFHGRALYELNGLPEQVRNGPLLERILQLLEEPWDTVPERPGQTAVRHAFFGTDDQGMLTVLVHEQTETLRIISGPVDEIARSPRRWLDEIRARRSGGRCRRAPQAGRHSLVVAIGKRR